MKQQCSTNYNLYGIVRTQKKIVEPNIIKFYFDMNDSNLLEHTMSIIKPDIIIHLASISSSQYAYTHPIETLYNNGMITAKLCDIIHKNGWTTKLFNASSSEMYKGHINYKVEENDTHMFHLHPYSIGKIMGHSMVDFYRITYGLPFSNGIIFTTESPLKRPEFLLNKIASHARNWTNNKNPLIVGNLDSFRNILHASDVANAINTIVSQEKGDTYVICSEDSDKIIDLVVKLYSISNVYLEKRDNILLEKDTYLPVVVIDKPPLGVDIVPTNIRSDPKKLKQLGWKPLISMDNILIEMINNKFSTNLYDAHIDISVRNYK
jgi:GDPmannose 4,6-dehydratase